MHILFKDLIKQKQKSKNTTYIMVKNWGEHFNINKYSGLDIPLGPMAIGHAYIGTVLEQWKLDHVDTDNMGFRRAVVLVGWLVVDE